jgi:Arc/MetJ-type ribon-helix-helix transcriptional regulator
MNSEGDLVKVNFRLNLEDYYKALELVRRGEYSSMSELVRHAVALLVSE